MTDTPNDKTLIDVINDVMGDHRTEDALQKVHAAIEGRPYAVTDRYQPEDDRYYFNATQSGHDLFDIAIKSDDLTDGGWNALVAAFDSHFL